MDENEKIKNSLFAARVENITRGEMMIPNFQEKLDKHLEERHKRKVMTPNDIEILLHCYYCSSEHPRFDALAVRDGIEMMVNEGLIYNKKENIYRTTKKGEAHVQQLRSLPFPRETFLDFTGKEIEV